jgi:8-oxo-dGTP pyrophosphatase MutT (NUDIX family)
MFDRLPLVGRGFSFQRGSSVRMRSVTPVMLSFLDRLAAHQPADGWERVSLERIREFVARSPAPFSRTNSEGHVTASAVVARPEDSAFLLVWHRKLGRWLQPGGHLEDSDPSIFAAAVREAREETGLERFTSPLGEGLLDVDVHPIPTHGPDPAHFHFDARYLLLATPPEPAPRDGEVGWFTLPRALESGVDESLSRALRKAAHAIAGLKSERLKIE